MDRGYGWVMVALGALMTCVAVGAMFSLAVFLEPMTRDTGWSRAGISSAMSLNFLAMGIAGFGWGALSDRIGTRKVVLAGAVLLGLGLAVASRATSQTAFLLSYGLIVGIAAGSFFAPMIAAVMSWFERNRSLAVSLVSVGVGVAPLTLSPFAAWLVARTIGAPRSSRSAFSRGCSSSRPLSSCAKRRRRPRPPQDALARR